MSDRPRFSLAVVTAMALVWCLPTWAGDGRDFAAFYDPQNPVEVGDDVLVRFVADLFNHTGEAIAGATVEVRGFLFFHEVYATLPAVEIPDGGSVRLSQEITLELEEYDSWQEGAGP